MIISNNNKMIFSRSKIEILACSSLGANILAEIFQDPILAFLEVKITIIKKKVCSCSLYSDAFTCCQVEDFGVGACSDNLQLKRSIPVSFIKDLTTSAKASNCHRKRLSKWCSSKKASRDFLQLLSRSIDFF